MTDSLASLRRKIRCVAEARYPVEPRFLDVRGNIISAVHPSIRDHLPHWTSEPGSILFKDGIEVSVDQFLISTKQIGIILEDPGTLQRFEDVTVQYLGYAYDALGKWIDSVDRFGVRFLEVLVAPDIKAYDELRRRVLDSFHRVPTELSLTYTDSMVRLVHEHGSYTIGPAQRNEEWIRQIFGRPDRNVPDIGLALDIDSFVSGVAIKKKEDLIRVFRATLGMTLAVEEALAKTVGFAHE